MALEIADYVLAGEIRNTQRNSVFGWIDLTPDHRIHIEITGNFDGSLAGKFLRFSMPKRVAAGDLLTAELLPPHILELAERQIGVLQKAQFSLLPAETSAGSTTAETRVSLHFVWSSQNGDISAHLIAPELTIHVGPISEEDEIDLTGLPPELLRYNFPHIDAAQVAISLNFEDMMGKKGSEDQDDEEGESRTPPFSIEAFSDELFEYIGNEDDDDDEDEDDDDDEAEDPYGLFGEGFQDAVTEALGDNVTGKESGAIVPRPWDEVIPDLDPATRAMYEQWDEIFEGKKDQPITYLFSETIKLPLPEHVTTNEQAEPLVKAILAQLAKLSVALDICAHLDYVATYRLLLREILPTAKVHPNLAASEMVQHYSTSDFCSLCEQELLDELSEEEAQDEFDDLDEEPDDLFDEPEDGDGEDEGGEDEDDYDKNLPF